jgi:hypothetical protein
MMMEYFLSFPKTKRLAEKSGKTEEKTKKSELPRFIRVLFLR